MTKQAVLRKKELTNLWVNAFFIQQCVEAALSAENEEGFDPEYVYNTFLKKIVCRYERLEKLYPKESKEEIYLPYYDIDVKNIEKRIEAVIDLLTNEFTDLNNLLDLVKIMPREDQEKYAHPIITQLMSIMQRSEGYLIKLRQIGVSDLLLANLRNKIDKWFNNIVYKYMGVYRKKGKKIKR